MRRNICVAMPLSLLCVCFASVPAGAGDLNPPPGPVAGTMKTLDEVEPRTPISQADIPLTITQPGSYYLTGNIEAVSPIAITIASDAVSLDLMGFTMEGQPNDVFHGDRAIFVSQPVKNVRVANGVIRRWRLSGIEAGDADNSVFADLRIESNGVDTGGVGLIAGRWGIVENVLASNNGGRGVQTGSRSVVRRCVAAQNGSDGIMLSGWGELVDCVSTENGGSGFLIGSGSQARGAQAALNAEHGFNLSFGGVAIECVAGNNGMAGFRAIVEAHIVGCRSHFNAEAGVLVTGSRNRIDQNNCVGNGVGIKANSGGNMITRNTVANSSITAYDIVGGNHVGAIMNTPVGAGAWDNFQH